MKSATAPEARYRRTLLTRLTTTAHFTELLQAELARDDDRAKHIFHKIMVHNWSTSADELFFALAERANTDVLPVQYAAEPDLVYFYTDSLSFVHKVIGFDFMFSYEGTIYNMDILFGDKTSTEMFGSAVSTEQVVSGVVSRRFSNTLELDLSSLRADPDLREKEIHIYSLSQLALYKRLMLRMGRDTKILNLSNNGLEQVPQEVMNFFMRGDIIGINLSDNKLESLERLPRMSSLLERLWLEGNPLCEGEDAASYVKKVSVLFPRLRELDGVSVNRYGFSCPLIRNHLVNTEARCLIDKLLTLYFTHYDSTPRSDMSGFYHPSALLSISTSLSETQLDEAPHWRTVSRNLVRQSAAAARTQLHVGPAASAALAALPDTTHDPDTFTVSLIHYTKMELVVCVDGVFRERREDSSDGALTRSVFHSRRTWLLRGQHGLYTIYHELLHVAPVSDDLVAHAFQKPIRRLNELGVTEPSAEQMRALRGALAHLSGLRAHEAERRLKVQGWDLRKALLVLCDELRSSRVPAHLFADPALDPLTDEDLD